MFPGYQYGARFGLRTGDRVEIMNQHTGTSKEWANTSNRWHFDAVLDIVLLISFGFHVGARRENILLKKDLGENGGFFLLFDIRPLFVFDADPCFSQRAQIENSTGISKMKK